MRPDGYEGNWKVFECTSDSCTGTVLKPVADVTESEFTVEDLNHIAEFND